jgi:hypothetical protein
MSKTKTEGKNLSTDERELIVAYLSYALDDVGAFSANGFRLLQLAIAAIAKEAAAVNSNATGAVALWN